MVQNFNLKMDILKKLEDKQRNYLLRQYSRQVLINEPIINVKLSWFEKIMLFFGYTKLDKDDYVLNKKDFIYFSKFYKSRQLGQMLSGQHCETVDKIIEFNKRIDILSPPTKYKIRKFNSEWYDELIAEKKYCE